MNIPYGLSLNRNKCVSNWKKGNRFWTFINVHFRIPKGRFENDTKKSVCYHNALKLTL